MQQKATRGKRKYIDTDTEIGSRYRVGYEEEMTILKENIIVKHKKIA